MQADLDTVTLTQSPHKGGTFILTNYVEVSEKLIAHITTTQEILGSEFMVGRVLKKTEKWLKQLKEIFGLIKEAQAFQNKWLQLEPTFGEIESVFEYKELRLQIRINRHTMPNEAAQYRQVTEFWETTMQSVQDDPSLTQNLAY